MSEGGKASVNNPIDLCECGHIADEHHWRGGFFRIWGKCSWCDCSEFKKVSVCPACKQPIKVQK